jgi:hypothetical protein
MTKTQISKAAIYRQIPNSSVYSVQLQGGKFYHATTSKKEAARIAYCNRSDGWPTKVRFDAGEISL